jgi:HEPN domain-containing protein
MGDLDHARTLITMAKKDLKALIGMVEGEPFEDEVFGLHVQQSVEKALKAWLALIGAAFPKTHDLTVLLTLLEKQRADIGAFWPLEQYSAFAVQFRYEAFSATESAIDREDVVEHVTDLVEKVEKLILEAEL